MRLLKSEALALHPIAHIFCHDFLQKKGYDIELAYEAGLLSRNEENFSYYDRFRNRIMFPFEKMRKEELLDIQVEHIPVKNQNT